MRLRIAARLPLARRCRAGRCFGPVPRELDVDEATACRLKADPFLLVSPPEEQDRPPADRETAPVTPNAPLAAAGEGGAEDAPPAPGTEAAHA